MDPVAVSLGGSFLVGRDGVDAALTRDIAAVLARASAQRRILAVVGGGAVARSYIEGARALGAGETAVAPARIDRLKWPEGTFRARNAAHYRIPSQ